MKVLILALALLSACSASAGTTESATAPAWSFDETTSVLTLHEAFVSDDYEPFVADGTYYEDELNLPPWYTLRHQITCVIIEDGVEAIGDDAFVACGNLASVYLPQSLRRIGADNFFGCRNLTTIYYTGTTEEWQEVSLTPGVKNTLSQLTLQFDSKNRPG